MQPLYSSTIESHLPVFNICCADASAAYMQRKQKQEEPAAALVEATKLSECVSQSIEKLKDTPCAKIHGEYAHCLSLKKGRIPCKPLKEELEECSAKHIGRLDA